MIALSIIKSLWIIPGVKILYCWFKSILTKIRQLCQFVWRQGVFILETKTSFRIIQQQDKGSINWKILTSKQGKFKQVSTWGVHLHVLIVWGLALSRNPILWAIVRLLKKTTTNMENINFHQQWKWLFNNNN